MSDEVVNNIRMIGCSYLLHADVRGFEISFKSKYLDNINPPDVINQPSISNFNPQIGCQFSQLHPQRRIYSKYSAEYIWRMFINKFNQLN